MQGLKQEGNCESRVLSFSILITNSTLGELILILVLLFRCMNLINCLSWNSCGMYCNCELVGLTFGCKAFYVYMGYNEGFGYGIG